jgi:adenylate cyclase class 2
MTGKTLLEVEMKFPARDLAATRAKLLALGAVSDGETLEVDTYLTHPSRDFALTDEAFRVRVAANTACLTYKGPKIDTTTKTRREIEVPLKDATCAEDALSLAEALGFHSRARVEKRRETFILSRAETTLHVLLDQVRDVGAFVEIEMIVAAHALDAARGSVQDLARELGLEHSERRSYLELLLARSQPRVVTP